MAHRSSPDHEEEEQREPLASSSLHRQDDDYETPPSSADWIPQSSVSKRRNKPNIISILLPDPTQPHAALRTCATAFAAIFLVVLVFITFFQSRGDDPATQLGWGWVYTDGVSWGDSSSRKPMEGQSRLDEVMSSGSNLSLSSGTGTVFAKEKSEQVNQLLEEGQLSQYVWHEKLELPEDRDGRLIIVGDIHGMHVHLVALLARLSFQPQHDTLLSVGDLVSKSPLNGSLETVRLMRSLGALGVRGNHDEGVLQWRAWMDGYGPLRAGRGTWAGEELPPMEKTKEDEGPGFWSGGSMGNVEEGEVNKRAWWNFGGSDSDESTTTTTPEVAQDVDSEPINYDTNYEPTPTTPDDDSSPQEDDTADAASIPLPSASSYSSFDSAPVIYDDPVESSTPSLLPFPSISSETPPSHGMSDETHGVSHANLLSSGALLSPSYDWLSLPVDSLAEIGVVVPEGWEWGGQWFDIARHLPTDDVEYLRRKPLSLWIDEWKTFIVHAGLVPSNTTAARSPRAPRPIPNVLSSSSATRFSPTGALYSLIRSSETHSLLLQDQNTDPFTLLNMRTLQTGEGGELIPSSHGKGNNAGQKWFEVWEEQERELNVVYGHWAGEGLTVKNNSIGLDTGCVYGRQLSALILSPSSESDPPSPLSTPASVDPTLTALSNYRVLSPGDVPPVLDFDKIFGPGSSPHSGPSPHSFPSAANSLGYTSSQSESRMRRRTKRDENEEELAEESTSEIPGAQVQDEEEQGETVKEVVEDKLGFEAWEVVINGRKGWVVSVECGAI